MRVEVIVKDLPYVGKKGTVANIPDNEAAVHIALGNARQYVPKIAPEKPAVVQRKAPRKKYSRKDVVTKPRFEIEAPKVEEPVDGESTE